MAGEIFVGSVSVGVVPDLRGFNDRIRAGLVPSANRIGKEIGKEISNGIVDALDIGKIVTDSAARHTATIRRVAYSIGGNFGSEMTRGIRNSLDIGKAVVEATEKARPLVKRTGRDLGADYGGEVRKGIELRLKGLTAKVRVDVELNKASLARVVSAVRLAIAADKAIAVSGGGGGGGGGGAGAGGNDFVALMDALKAAGFGGGAGRGGGGGRGVAPGGDDKSWSRFFGTIFQALRPGGTTPITGVGQAFTYLPPQAQAGIAVPIIAALPLVGQQIGSIIVSGFGSILAGMGIAGAVGLGGQATQAQITTAQGKLTVAQDRQAAAQARLNQLQNSGKATTSQLASAQATLAGAHQSVATAQQNLSDLQSTGLTAGQQAVRDSFSNLTDDVKTSLATIGTSFVPVMQSIFNTADTVLQKMTPIFAGAVKTISGPFQVFVNTIIKAFGSPQVQTSIEAVAKAFGGILQAITPDIPGIINSFADAIERIANAVAKNPKAFADFINFLFQIGIMVLNVIAYLTDIADYIEFHFTPAMHRIAVVFDGVRHEVAHIWDMIWNNTIGRAERGLHDIATMFDVARHAIATTWDNIYRDTIGKVVGLFERIKSYVTTSFDKWWSDNGDAIKRIWTGIWTALIWIFRIVFGPIILFVKTMFDGIVGLFKSEGGTLSTIWRIVWDVITAVVKFAIGIIRPIVKIFWDVLQSTFKIGVEIIKTAWGFLWGGIVAVLRITWATIRFIMKTAWDVVIGIFTVAINLLTGRWGAAWNAIKNLGIQIWNNLKQFFMSTWNAVSQFWAGRLTDMKNVAIAFWNFLKTFWNDSFNVIKNITLAGWHWIYNNVWSPVYNFFTRTLPSWLDTAVHFVDTHWVQPFKNNIKAAWDWIYSHVWSPVHDFLTRTLPGWFDSAVNSVSGIWNKIKHIISVPIQWVAKNVLVHLYNAIDDVTSFVGLGKPLQGTVNTLQNIQGAATGKYISTGAGPKIDDNLALLARGELVVPTDMVDAGLVDHLRGRIPGFQGGGAFGVGNMKSNVQYSNPVGPGAKSARIDMGVDYTGTFDLFALGSGNILNLYNAGWPGGTFMTLQLDQGPRKGSLWYYAEHIIPTVGVGQHVRAGQLVGHAPGGSPWTELGWAANPTGLTMAAASGQNRAGLSHGDPGAYSTAWGVDASNMIVSLGGPSGIVVGPVQGGGSNPLKSIWGFITRTVDQILGGIGKFSSIAISLAKGDLSGAVSKLLGSTAKGAGGAAGTFAKVLLALPSKLVHYVLNKIMGGVKSFVSGQQAQDAASGGGAAAGIGGAGVQRWRNVALQALAMENLPASYIGYVLDQMQSESGGSPRSINLTDINAQLGTPSKGLMQVIDPTFRMWHWPGTSWDIYDPLANIAAALNYAAHGKGFGRGMGQLGSMHGYQSGGPIDEPVIGWGAWTGDMYRFAESGREWVVPDKAIAASSGGSTYIAHFDSLTGQAIEGHVRTAYQAMAITAGNLQRQGRRS